MINDALTGLELAKYISLRLVDNNETQVPVDFENDVRFVTRVVKFLKNVGWIKQVSNGSASQVLEA
jgi:hypothetical protein